MQLCSRTYHMPRGACFKQAKPRCVTAKPLRLNCKAAVVADQQVSVQSYDQLKSYLASKGVAVDKVSISTSIDTGKPILVAAKELAPGESIFSVSDNAWLSTETVKKSPVGKHVAGLEPWLQITLALVAERFGSSSNPEFKAYVDSLPSSTNSPLFWSDEQLQMIQGTQLLESVMGYR